MVVKLLEYQGEGVRDSGPALLFGYLGDGIGLHTEVREVSDHERRVCRKQDSLADSQSFQWKNRHEIDAEA